MSTDTTAPVRCFGTGDPLYEAYHDHEWGRPVRGDAALLERIVLEGAQSGLSWLTILRKRDGYRAAFAGFEPAAVAAYSDGDVERLMADPGIVRNRRKIESAITNARATVALREAGGSLTELFWSFAPEPRGTRLSTWEDVPAATPESIALAKALKRAGFVFVGPTTMYAAMQACGLVDDHLADCVAVGA
ncbi:DNA-3-methyladenine glycosylase I [Demequina sp. SYSU T00068]|uniref:DNA-3-methyladenine glycosylase I n=1 Tax=Demequina lignilytica TaxID=3051663 RepID=UPI00263853D4|nr:DNA-3-methyladenine glycosylase I [Demequina sp. SYSU T00068]MDN4491359.1 DNA-3-methyladenine glycosylase I [Demequina sp. SYSU T00068]